MSFKLTKEELKQKRDLIAALTTAEASLESAVETFNAALEKAKEPLEQALTAYNELLEEARGFAQDIASQADQDISEKSEKWQEGDRGQAAQEWKDEWEGLLLDGIEIELPEPIELNDPTAPISGLEDAPEEAAS